MDRFWRYIAQRLVNTGELATVALTPPSTAEETFPSGDVSPERVFHDAAKAYLDQQFASNRDLDTRMAQSIQVGSVVVTIAFGLLALGKSQIRVPDHARTCLYLALGAYALVLVSAVVASRFSTLSYRPNIPTLAGYVDDFEGADLLHWVGLEYTASTQINERRLAWKQRLVGVTVVCLYLEGICLALAAFFTLH